MKNLMKGISLMVVFLSFQGLVHANDIAVPATTEKAKDAVAAVTGEEEKKAEEVKSTVTEQAAIPAVPSAQ